MKSEVSKESNGVGSLRKTDNNEKRHYIRTHLSASLKQSSHSSICVAGRCREEMHCMAFRVYYERGVGSMGRVKGASRKSIRESFVRLSTIWAPSAAFGRLSFSSSQPSGLCRSIPVAMIIGYFGHFQTTTAQLQQSQVCKCEMREDCATQYAVRRAFVCCTI